MVMVDYREFFTDSVLIFPANSGVITRQYAGILNLDYSGIIGSVYIGLFEMGITFVIWHKALELLETTSEVGNLFLSDAVYSPCFHRFCRG